ncbi:MAG: PotD/PotF family extracellular solute-binding protein [Actinomycetes bacterium]
MASRPRRPFAAPDPFAGTPLSRRSFLRAAGAVGLLAASPALLAACGSEGSDGGGGGGGGGDGGGTVAWSNWPLYIDVSEEDENVRPTLERFMEESGITVEYTEDINDNDEFFGKIQPQLEAGRSTGRDLVVLTDWMAARMIRLGYLEELDHDNIPNLSNLRASLQDVPFDPGRRYTVPWQSGMTGIGYNPTRLGRELTSFDDLLADDLKGRVTMLTEMRDTMGLVLLSMGKDPADHTMADFEAAIAKLQKAVDDGVVRQFTGNEYAADLASGNVAAAIAWSGDVIQLQADDPDMMFLVPEQGGMLWSDNLMVPKGAANKSGAEKVIDFYYQPDVAAEVAAWVNYVTPVEGAQEAMEEIDEELAADPLIFPDEEMTSRLHPFMDLDEEQERQYQDMFQKVIGA